MILFWVICVAMIAIALAFVVPPLWQRESPAPSNNDKEANVAVYRDQLSELQADRDNGSISPEQYAIERDEIERRLLNDVAAANPPTKNISVTDDRRFAYALALVIPALTAALYLKIGDSKAITTLPTPPARDATPNRGMRSQQDIQANVDALAKRLEQNPTDANGWRMLGRSYLTLERYKDSAVAFARASALRPGDADLLADYAFALGMANGRRLSGQPKDLIDKALKLDPENPKALELAGTAAYEVKNYTEAIGYWERLLKKSSDPELTNALTERINRAKSMQSAAAQ